MGTTSFGINDPRTQKKFAADLFDQAWSTSRLLPLCGKTDFDIIRLNQDLTRQAGGSVVFELPINIAGAGVGDDGDTRNNAQSLTYGNQSVFVHTRATRTEAAGAWSLQLTSHRGTEAFRTRSRAALAETIKDYQENDLLGSLAGLYNENMSSSAIETINEVYPSASRIMYLGQEVDATPTLGNSGVSYGTDALLTAGTQTANLFGTLVVARARRMAVMASPRIRPGRFFQTPASQERSVQFPVDQAGQGKLIGDLFVCLASPYQIESLMSEIGPNGFAAMQQAAAQRGNSNPLFTGGAALHRGALIVEWERIPYRTGAGSTAITEGFLLNGGRTATTDACASGRSVARALFLGANAGLMAWAMPFGWWEGYEDGNKPFVKTEGLYGCKVSQFNAHGGSSAGAEEARICIDTEIVI